MIGKPLRVCDPSSLLEVERSVPLAATPTSFLALGTGAVFPLPRPHAILHHSQKSCRSRRQCPAKATDEIERGALQDTVCYGNCYQLAPIELDERGCLRQQRGVAPEFHHVLEKSQ